KALVRFLDFVNRGLVFEGSHVAEGLAFRHRLDQSPHYLPAPRLGELVDEEDLGGFCYWTEVGPNPPSHLRPQFLRGSVALPQHDEGHWDFPPDWVRDS